MTRWTEEQVAEFARRNRKPIVAGEGHFARVAPVKKSKYRNVRCKSADGKSFASKLECAYYEQLLLRWAAGEVLWFVRQPSFDLEGGVIYRADFLVVSRRPSSDSWPVRVDVVDTKGYQDQAGKNKLRQVEARYGIEVQLVRSVS